MPMLRMGRKDVGFFDYMTDKLNVVCRICSMGNRLELITFLGHNQCDGSMCKYII